MARVAVLLIVALGLAGCDSVNTLTDGLKHSRAVESDLEAAVGMRPQVGFNWSNGSLTMVTVTFPRIEQKRSLPELADTVRQVVAKNFQQTPRDIVLGFSLAKSSTETHADAEAERVASNE
jgi:uncharacterized protein YceK